MNSLQLISNKKQLIYLLLLLFTIFIFNILYEYFKYKDFVKEEIYLDKYQIINIYEKKDYTILKLQNQKLGFFTSINKSQDIEKLNYISIAIITKNINFYDFLKGFYAKSIFYEDIQEEKSFKKTVFEKINQKHENEKIQELFNALFLAIPISKENRQIYTDFGISHLIAISGFHLSIISGFIFLIIYYPYSFFQSRFFPFRNKKSDVIVITILILLYYLYLTNLVPSLLRSFVMFVLAFLFLRSNIKVFSFETLAFTSLIIISVFPKYLFSVSLWFSIIGVFYIFLYIHYFKNLPKIVTILFFNFWIFFVFNPIVHFFFSNTSYEQLLSPFLTIFFTIFYPVEAFLHLSSYANIFDKYILMFLEYEIEVFDFTTSSIFFVFYVLSSLFSIFNKKAFVVLNISMVLYNLIMYL